MGMGVGSARPRVVCVTPRLNQQRALKGFRCGRTQDLDVGQCFCRGSEPTAERQLTTQPPLLLSCLEQPPCAADPEGQRGWSGRGLLHSCPSELSCRWAFAADALELLPSRLLGAPCLGSQASCSHLPIPPPSGSPFAASGKQSLAPWLL